MRKGRSIGIGFRFWRPAAFGLILAFSLPACSYISLPETAPRASVRILFTCDTGFGARTILPAVDMAPASYDVAGEGPGAAAFLETGITGAVFEKDDLYVGLWNFVVTARNSKGQAIGEGKGSADLILNAAVPARMTIDVKDFSGTGSLKITLRWPEGALTNARIEAAVERPGGSPAAAVFVAGGDGRSLVWEDSAAASGFYFLTVNLLAGAEEILGEADAIRVVKNTLTEHTYEYTVDQVKLRLARPVLSLAGGNYDGDRNLSISCATPGATIMYTNNGSVPSATNGLVYNDEISITSSQTLRAVAVMSGRANSGVASARYDIAGSFAVPTFSHAPGVWYEEIVLELKCATTGARIMYYIGSTPETTPTPSAYSGIPYTTPIRISDKATIKMLSKNDDGEFFSDLTMGSFLITGHLGSIGYNPPSGTYNQDQILTLVPPDTLSFIRYTLDGTVPTAVTGLAYSGPIAIDKSMAVKAGAFRTDWDPSPLVTLEYAMAIAPLTYNLAVGTYNSEQSLSFACATSGVQIRYTTDGSDPSETSGQIFNGPITIDKCMTVKAAAYRSGWTSLPPITLKYTMKVPTPVADIFPGTYYATLNIGLSCPLTYVSIRYATGTVFPSSTSDSLYAAPVSIVKSNTINVIAYRTGWIDSEIGTFIYTLKCSPPTFSPAPGSYIDCNLGVKMESKPTPQPYGIIYSTDGDDPMPNSNDPYGTYTIISGSQTIKAVAVKAGWAISDVAVGEYKLCELVSNPANGVDIIDTTPFLDWSNSAIAQGYWIQLDDAADFLTPLVSDDQVVESSYQMTMPLSDRGSYWWRLKIKGANGEWSAWNPTWAFSVALPVPVLSLPIAGETVPSVSPKFSWTAGGEIAGYRLQIAPMSDFSAPVVDTSDVATSPYTQIGNIANNSTYYWRVAARNIDGVWSAFSGGRPFRTDWNPIITELAPIGPAIIVTTPLLEWTVAPEASGYELQIAENITALLGAVTITTTDSKYQVATAFANDSTRVWRVRPKNAGVVGEYRGPWSFTVSLPRPVPASPTGTIDDMTPSFTWSGVDDATYRLQVSTSSTFATFAIDIQNILTPNYNEIPTLANDTTYYWRVAAKNKDGVLSNFSDHCNFTVSWHPSVDAVLPISGNTINNTTPFLDWTDAAATASYELQLAATVADFATANTITVTSSNYQTTTALTNGAITVWRVRPVNPEAIPGEWQGPWSFRVSVGTGIGISPEMHDPLTMSLSGIPEILYDDLTVVATASVSTNPGSFIWSLDGTDITGAVNGSYTLVGSSVRIGYHTLTCSVRLNGVSASASYRFRKTDEAIPPQLLAPADGTTIGAILPNFDWTDCADAEKYRIQIASDVVFATILADDDTLSVSAYTPSGTLYDDIDFNGGSCYWRVRWLLASGTWSTWTGVSSFNLDQGF